jgi:hypothetical protein
MEGVSGEAGDIDLAPDVNSATAADAYFGRVAIRVSVPAEADPEV